VSGILFIGQKEQCSLVKFNVSGILFIGHPEHSRVVNKTRVEGILVIRGQSEQ